MPVYDYLCTTCDHRADILHGINDPGPNFCPSCGSEGTMRKQFAAPAVHFKGTGWAKKDRRSSSMTRAAARSTSGDGDSAGSSERARDAASDRAREGAGEGARDAASDRAREGVSEGARDAASDRAREGARKGTSEGGGDNPKDSAKGNASSRDTASAPSTTTSKPNPTE
jgi:putative FmdB family regulatory protein